MVTPQTASDRTSLGAILDGEPRRWRAGLDARYAVIEDVLDGRRPAVVYPAARLGRAVAQGLSSSGADITAFGDGDPNLDGTRLDGLPVLSPAAVADQHGGDPILASAMYDSAIREDLEARAVGTSSRSAI